MLCSVALHNQQRAKQPFDHVLRFLQDVKFEVCLEGRPSWDSPAQKPPPWQTLNTYEFCSTLQGLGRAWKANIRRFTESRSACTNASTPATTAAAVAALGTTSSAYKLHTVFPKSWRACTLPGGMPATARSPTCQRPISQHSVQH